MLGQYGVAPHIPVVLFGDERSAAQVRTAKQRKQSRAQFGAGRGPRQPAERSAFKASWDSGRATGRWYTGPSWATVRGGTSTTVSPCQVIRNRSPSVTSPITVASTSHLRHTARNASTFSGATTAHIRSCDSLDSISAGVISGPLRDGVQFDRIPPSPADASSDVAQDNPAPPSPGCRSRARPRTARGSTR